MGHSQNGLKGHEDDFCSSFIVMRSTRTGLARFWAQRSLLRKLAYREVVGRYRGSMLGLLWSFVTPLVLLAVYTLVFSGVFNAQWTDARSSGKAGFALILFAGLIVFTFVADCLNRAPTLILTHANYVKKVVFPLEILPLAVTIGALFHAFISILALILTGMLIGEVTTPSGLFWVPLILLPIIVYVLGISWVLASLGVFVRDVGQAIGLVTTVLMFASPVFYPLSALPDGVRFWLSLNPLAYTIEELRNILLFGSSPHLLTWSVHLLLSLLVARAGLLWFQRTRGGFADVM